MELKQYLAVLWKWSWLIILSTVVATASSYWATTRMPRIYRTSTTLMVGRFIQTDDPSGQDFYISQQLAQSYLELVRRQPILQGTVDALGLETDWQVLAGQVTANLVPGTQLLQVNVQDTDPQRAKILADEIAIQLIRQSPTPVEQEQSQQREFVNERLTVLQAQIEEAENQVKELEQRLALENSARGIQDIQNQIETLQQKISTWQTNYASLLDFTKGSRTNYLSVVETALVPTTPVSPRVEYFLMLAAAIGFSLAAGAAFLLDFLDNTLKTPEAVEQMLKLPTLGTIPRLPKIREDTDHLITMRDTYSPITEAYRVLRTNIQFVSLNYQLPWLLISSAIPGEGKSTTASNLAITLAYSGKQVILVDADLRRPSIHRFFGISNQIGLTNILLDDSLPLIEILLDSPLDRLKLLPSGPLPPNPSDILGSEMAQQRLTELKNLADIIIFDSPPVLAVADASILGAICNGVILVTDSSRTRPEAVKQAKETLVQLDLKILGVVLNNQKIPKRSYYHYDYYSNAVKKKRRGKNTKVAPGDGLLKYVFPASETQEEQTSNGRKEKIETIRKETDRDRSSQ